MTHIYRVRNSNLGWFPENREIKPLGVIGSFSKGKGISNCEKKDKGLPCVTYGEIYTKHDFIVKKFNSFIDPGAAKKSQQIQSNSILFAGSGETADEIGKCVAYTKNEEAYAGGDIVIFKPKGVHYLDLAYVLNSDLIARQRRKLGQGYSYTNGLKTIGL